MAQLYFFGATRQVTGSQHLLEVTDGLRILVDCGIDMQASADKRVQFAAPPASIDVVILTHAHIDHSGLLPVLVAGGFDGPIYCTHATYQLVHILLRDAARLNIKKFGRRRHKPADYYDSKMVEQIWDQFITVDHSVEQSLQPSVSMSFHPVGHLLGAASVQITWDEGDGEKSILFSGDIGRKNDPLLEDPEAPPIVDYLVCESTYGGRFHQDTDSPEEIVRQIILETCVNQSGRLIVPAFSVGRTQAFLYVLHRLQQKGLLPAIPVFTDSPMARRSTRVYEDFLPFLNSSARDFGEHNGSLFEFDQVTYLSDMNSAEQIQNYHDSCIILTSSGMVRGGKSEDHVMMNLQNPFCTILFIGYCAEGTLGDRLLRGKSSLHLDREHIPVNARIERTDVFSGHADHGDLVEFVMHQDTNRLKKVFLVHGEEESMESLRDALNEGGYETVIPRREQYFQL